MYSLALHDELQRDVMTMACTTLTEWRCLMAASSTWAACGKSLQHTVVHRGHLFAYAKRFVGIFSRYEEDDQGHALGCPVYSFRIQLCGFVRRMWRLTRAPRNLRHTPAIYRSILMPRFRDLFVFKFYPSRAGQVLSASSRFEAGSGFYVAYHPTNNFALMFYRPDGTFEEPVQHMITVVNGGGPTWPRSAHRILMDDGSSVVLKHSPIIKPQKFNTEVADNHGLPKLGVVQYYNHFFVTMNYLEHLHEVRPEIWGDLTPQTHLWRTMWRDSWEEGWPEFFDMDMNESQAESAVFVQTKYGSILQDERFESDSESCDSV